MRALVAVAAVAALALAATFVPGCGSTGRRSGGAAVCVLEPASGSKVTGRATFRPMGGGWIHLKVRAEGLTPGLHAIHIHEKGDCSSGDGMSTGGHWNPTGKKHGKWGQADGEFHLGDLGNMEAGADGVATFELTTDRWSIGGNGVNDILGKAIIVHGGADDFRTDPTGNAGNRIGCGIIVSDSR